MAKPVVTDSSKVWKSSYLNEYGKFFRIIVLWGHKEQRQHFLMGKFHKEVSEWKIDEEIELGFSETSELQQQQKMEF